MLNGYVKLHAGASGFSFLQNIVDGSQPTSAFSSLDKSIEFFEILTYSFTIIMK